MTILRQTVQGQNMLTHVRCVLALIAFNAIASLWSNSALAQNSVSEFHDALRAKVVFNESDFATLESLKHNVTGKGTTVTNSGARGAKKSFNSMLAIWLPLFIAGGKKTQTFCEDLSRAGPESQTDVSITA